MEKKMPERVCEQLLVSVKARGSVNWGRGWMDMKRKAKLSLRSSN